MTGLNFYIYFDLFFMILVCFIYLDIEVYQECCEHSNLAVHDENYLYSRAEHVNFLILRYKFAHINAA